MLTKVGRRPPTQSFGEKLPTYLVYGKIECNCDTIFQDFMDFVTNCKCQRRRSGTDSNPLTNLFHNTMDNVGRVIVGDTRRRGGNTNRNGATRNDGKRGHFDQREKSYQTKKTGKVGTRPPDECVGESRQRNSFSCAGRWLSTLPPGGRQPTYDKTCNRTELSPHRWSLHFQSCQFGEISPCATLRSK